MKMNEKWKQLQDVMNVATEETIHQKKWQRADSRCGNRIIDNKITCHNQQDSFSSESPSRGLLNLKEII